MKYRDLHGLVNYGLLLLPRKHDRDAIPIIHETPKRLFCRFGVQRLGGSHVELAHASSATDCYPAHIVAKRRVFLTKTNCYFSTAVFFYLRSDF